MTNSGTDIDVLTNFQPMPKRFMVWDKEFKTFYTELLEVWEIVSNFRDFSEQLKKNRYIFCQSTNLFDKDGKEIFEGSIVEDSEGDIGVIKFENSQWVINWQNDEFVSYRVDQNDADGFKRIGHILSSPELLEEK